MVTAFDCIAVKFGQIKLEGSHLKLLIYNKEILWIKNALKGLIRSYIIWKGTIHQQICDRAIFNYFIFYSNKLAYFIFFLYVRQETGPDSNENVYLGHLLSAN